MVTNTIEGTMPHGLEIHNWVANTDHLTTGGNIVDVWSGDDPFKSDVFIHLVSEDSQHGEYIEISRESGRYYKNYYRLFVRTR